MKKIEICKVTDEDGLNRCLQLRETVFVAEKGVPRDIEIDRYDALNDTCVHFLARSDGKDVGTARCLTLADDAVKAQRFCVLKEYRGHGVGQALMAYIEAYCIQRAVAKIELHAKYEAAGFYEKCGFAAVSDVFFEAGVKHVKMVKALTPDCKGVQL